MNNKLYFISRTLNSNLGTVKTDKIKPVYSNIKDALDELNRLYETEQDFTQNNYLVRCLERKENNYVINHETYYCQKRYSSN